MAQRSTPHHPQRHKQVAGDDTPSHTSSESNAAAASVTYTVAPGLSTNLAYTSWDEDDASGTGVAAYIKVTF